MTTRIARAPVPSASAIHPLFNEALKRLDRLSGSAYAHFGEESIPPECLLRAELLQVLCTIRSARQLVEQINYILLFVHLSVLAPMIPLWTIRCSAKISTKKRLNDIHASRTVPEAKSYKKLKGGEAKMAYLRHLAPSNGEPPRAGRQSPDNRLKFNADA